MFVGRWHYCQYNMLPPSFQKETTIQPEPSNLFNILFLMKKTLNIMSLSCLLFAGVLLSCDNNNPVGPEPPKDKEGTVYYTQTDALFPNPERGMYTQINFDSENMTKTLSEASLRNLREDNITLVFNYYYLNAYRDKDIDDQYLQRLEKNMQILRSFGAKTILRFAYTSGYSEKDKPWDAPVPQVLRHVEQIAPYLQEYADVIFCLQAGFVGAWGEWYYTSHFGYPIQDVDSRNALLEALLKALPQRRMLAVRTPEYKTNVLRTDFADTLTYAEAYSGSDKARLAAHNDCFVASQNDVGTFSGVPAKNYWAKETRFTVMGGETCGTSYYSTCDNALQQLQRFHWTYLNRSYHPEVLNSWMKDGCMDEIKARLGYRFVLEKAWFTPEPQAGQSFTAELQIHNVGFAAPCNPRDLQLVFVADNQPDDKVVIPFTSVDPRTWYADGDGIHQIILTAVLPDNMHGTYTLYLNLPDPEPALANNPFCSIRLANEDMWEETTGYNKLTTLTLP